MKVGELIQRIQSLYSKGVESDDTRLRPRHIYNKLLTARDFYLSSTRSLSGIYQTLRCIKLERYDGCKCGVCGIWRAKIPAVVYRNGSPLISYIKSKNGNDILLLREETDISGYKYINNRLVSFYENGYLYFINKMPPREIYIRAVFQDPVEILSFEGECNNCLSAYDLEFPISNDKIEPVIEMAVKELIQVFQLNKEDQSSDTRDSVNIK